MLSLVKPVNDTSFCSFVIFVMSLLMFVSCVSWDALDSKRVGRALPTVIAGVLSDSPRHLTKLWGWEKFTHVPWSKHGFYFQKRSSIHVHRHDIGLYIRRYTHYVWIPNMEYPIWASTIDTSMGISGSNTWRYVSTILLAIFCGDIPLHRPRYLHFRILKFPLNTHLFTDSYGDVISRPTDHCTQGWSSWLKRRKSFGANTKLFSDPVLVVTRIVQVILNTMHVFLAKHQDIYMFWWP